MNCADILTVSRGGPGSDPSIDTSGAGCITISMANLWRDEPRYIVIGAQRLSDGKMHIPGITEHIDGVLLVQALEGLVHPCPRLHYDQAELAGSQFGVVSIPPDRSIGPFFATRDVGGGDGMLEPILRKNALYCRRDSSNVEASPGEQAAIWKWFQEGQALPPLQFPAEDKWTKLLDLSQLTNANIHHVLLLALESHSQDTNLANLAAFDWSMVIDLDPASQLNGALKAVRAGLSKRRAVHVVTPDGKLLGDVSRATSWYFASGLQVAEDSLPQLKYKDWVVRYGKAASAKIEQLAAACSGPVSVIALCERADQALVIRKIIEDIATNFGDRAKCAAVSNSDDGWSTLEQHEMATVVQMDIRHFLEGLAAHARSIELGAENVVQLPGLDGVPKDISGEDLAYLEEDLDFVHLATGTRGSGGVGP